jgi:hypothetical protein
MFGGDRPESLPPFMDQGVLQRVYVRVMALVSRLTAPFRARALPSSVAPVFSVIDSRAMIVPLKLEFVPKVAYFGSEAIGISE